MNQLSIDLWWGLNIVLRSKFVFFSYYNCLDAGHGLKGLFHKISTICINPLLPHLVLQEGQGKKDCISGHCVWVSEALPVGESQQHLLCGAVTLDLMWSGCPFSILGFCTFFHLSQHHNIFQHWHGGVAGGGDKLELNWCGKIPSLTISGAFFCLGHHVSGGIVHVWRNLGNFYYC